MSTINKHAGCKYTKYEYYFTYSHRLGVVVDSVVGGIVSWGGVSITEVEGRITSGVEVEVSVEIAMESVDVAIGSVEVACVSVEVACMSVVIAVVVEVITSGF